MNDLPPMYERIIRWLDADERRTLTLFSGNAKSMGPCYRIDFGLGDGITRSLFDDTRESIMDVIERDCP